MTTNRVATDNETKIILLIISKYVATLWMAVPLLADKTAKDSHWQGVELGEALDLALTVFVYSRYEPTPVHSAVDLWIYDANLYCTIHKMTGLNLDVQDPYFVLVVLMIILEES